jgi:NAD(P) transhydrogenase subunit alpha
MSVNELAERAAALASEAAKLAAETGKLAIDVSNLEAMPAAAQAASGAGGDGFVSLFTVFILACFVGYYVVWRVTPALHSPLMSVTNAISSVIIVGALIAAGPAEMNFSQIMGFFAVVLASVNIFGGFIVSQRMLAMFRKKK